MRVIAISNQKGGTAKTTTAVAMFEMLVENGNKTLLIDADPQRNATEMMEAQIEGVATLYDVVAARERVNINEAIQHTKHGDIIASDPNMISADIIFTQDPLGMNRFKDSLADLDPSYEYVIVDTSPKIDRILFSVLVAADEVIIPTNAQKFAAMGIMDLYSTINEIQTKINPDLRISGILITNFRSNTKFEKKALIQTQEAAEKMGTKVYKHPIRSTIKVGEAQGLNRMLYDYDPFCTASQDYTEFVTEFLKDEKKLKEAKTDNKGE